MRFSKMAAALAAAAFVAAAGPAGAQYAVNDAQLNGQAGQINGALGQANGKLDRAIQILSGISEQMQETARNTASTLDQAQRQAQSLGDPREKASRREVRQKWIIGGQGYGRVASAADAVRPVGASWSLRLNQPRNDGSDVRPSIDVLADPGLAARYSRQAYSVTGAEPTQTARLRIEARRKSELTSAAHDAHGMALHSILATSGTHRRQDRLLTIADEAYEAGLADQIFALNMSVVALLEEQAALRGLVGQQVRMAAAAQMTATPAYGSSPPVLAAPGTNNDMVYEYGIDGNASATTDPGASAGNLAGSTSAGSVQRSVAARGDGGPGSWSFVDALDFATQPGDFVSSLGGIGGVGCPYSTMLGSRGSGCLQSVARLLLGEMGVSGQSGRTIMAVVSGGLSARTLGVQGTTLDMRTVSNMFGLGGMMSCFGGNPSTCSYSCQRLATERMPGGRCDSVQTPGFSSPGGGSIPADADPVGGLYREASLDAMRNGGRGGYCTQLAYSCQNEGLGFSSIPGFSNILSGLTGSN